MFIIWQNQLKNIKNEKFLKNLKFDFFHDAKFEKGTFSCAFFNDDHDTLNLIDIVVLFTFW